MQFTIAKSEFLDGITKVQGITSRRTSFPITANTLINAGQGNISIVATDLEIGFRGFYEAEVQTPGTTTLPGRKLFEIVKEFPSEKITCRLMENGWIEIADKSVQYQIVGMDPEDFPKLPDVSETAFVKLNSKSFSDMIEKSNLTGGLTSEEKRPHLIGVYLECLDSPEPGAIRLVATDGNRLAKVDYPLAGGEDLSGLKKEKGVILPKKVLPEMLKLTEGAKEVQLGITGNYFVLARENETLIGRLVEGEYPDYNLVIPKGIKTFFDVEKALFMMTLRRMSILCTERYRAVRFKVEADKLTVRIVNPEIGESREEIPIVFNGEPFEVAFNPKFFIEAMNTMNSETIRVRIENEQKACILEGEDDPSYMSVIMPMRM